MKGGQAKPRSWRHLSPWRQIPHRCFYLCLYTHWPCPPPHVPFTHPPLTCPHHSSSCTSSSSTSSMVSYTSTMQMRGAHCSPWPLICPLSRSPGCWTFLCLHRPSSLAARTWHSPGWPHPVFSGSLLALPPPLPLHAGGPTAPSVFSITPIIFN